jgi:hypothetical protein
MCHARMYLSLMGGSCACAATYSSQFACRKPAATCPFIEPEEVLLTVALLDCLLLLAQAAQAAAAAQDAAAAAARMSASGEGVAMQTYEQQGNTLVASTHKFAKVSVRASLQRTAGSMLAVLRNAAGTHSCNGSSCSYM